jgi:hypothetical protein
MRNAKQKQKRDDPVPVDITVRVDGKRWRRVLTLSASGPTDRVYVVKTDPDGSTTVRFGDGVNGAALPIGAYVAVTYRHGGGKPKQTATSGSRPADITSKVKGRGLTISGIR